jgi:hypothetical protein
MPLLLFQSCTCIEGFSTIFLFSSILLSLSFSFFASSSNRCFSSFSFSNLSASNLANSFASSLSILSSILAIASDFAKNSS